MLQRRGGGGGGWPAYITLFVLAEPEQSNVSSLSLAF